MNRLTDVDDARVAYWRQDNHDAAAVRGEDDDLDPLDRRDRSVVVYYKDQNNADQPSALKRGDDVEWCGIQIRVVGPARDRNFFLGYYDPWFGDMILPCSDVQYVTDRAPQDTNETPMPVVPEVTP